jgi:uncharacterized coiled-coil protein SlyX
MNQYKDNPNSTATMTPVATSSSNNVDSRLKLLEQELAHQQSVMAKYRRELSRLKAHIDTLQRRLKDG